jgi:pyridoxine kinase
LPFALRILADLEITSLDSLKQVLMTLHTKHRVPHVLFTSVELPQEDLERIGLQRNLSDGSPGMTLIGSSMEGDASGSRLRPWVIQFPEVQGYFSGVGDLFAALLVGRYKRPKEAQSVTTSAPPSRSDSPLPNQQHPGIGLRTNSSLLDELHSAPTPLSRATELAIASVQAVLAQTSEHIARAPPMPSQEEWEASLFTPASIKDGQKDLGEEEREQRWKAQEKVENFRRRELKIVQSRDGIEEPVVKYRARWLER